VAEGASRRELEAAWLQRLKYARSRYEEKAAIRKELLAERREWPISLKPDPDGRFALHQALQEESAARTEYMRILRIFSKLMFEGTLPEGEPGLFVAGRKTDTNLHRLSAGNDEEDQESPFPEMDGHQLDEKTAWGRLFVHEASKRGYTIEDIVDARPSRRELEAAWRQRVNRARSRYEEKLAIRRQMVGERLEWPISLAPDPDGRFALNQALQEESAARTEYMRILRIYTEFILHGMLPEEDPGS
jgi:hypothetical protein